MNIPPSVQACLWSYDTSLLDIQRDKILIIRNVLNHGTLSATQWLHATYSKDDLKEAVRTSPESAWSSKKSLNFWSTLLEVTPQKTTRMQETSI